MAFQVNFQPTDDALGKASWMIMQNWFGAQDQLRNMEYLKEQEESYSRGRQEAGRIEQARLAELARQSKDAARESFAQFLAKSPPARALQQRAIHAEALGDMESANAFNKQISDMWLAEGPGISEGLTNYTTRPEQVGGLFKFFEPSQATDILTQELRNRGQAKELDFKYKELDYLNRKQKGEDADKVIKRYLDKVGDVKKFYEELRKGKTVQREEKMGMVSETKEPPTDAQVKLVDDRLQLIGQLESRIIDPERWGSVTADDLEWLDQQYNFTIQQAADTKARDYFEKGILDPETGQKKFFDSYDEAMDYALSEERMKTGTAWRRPGIAAPIDKELLDATDGAYTFAGEGVPPAFKQKIWAIYKNLKELSGMPPLEIIGKLFNEYPWMKDYIIQVKDQEERAPKEEPAPVAKGPSLPPSGSPMLKPTEILGQITGFPEIPGNTNWMELLGQLKGK